MPSGNGDTFPGGAALVLFGWVVALVTVNLAGILIMTPLAVLVLLLLWERWRYGQQRR